MPLATWSRYAEVGLPALAAVASRDALRGAADDGDAVMTLLHLEARQFLHGACSLLASHLQESRDLPVILIEGRPPGQGWMTRHAMACRSGEEEALALIEAGRGSEVRVLDAAGGGTAGARLPLYHEPGWDHRVILGRDPRCGARWMWDPRAGRPRSEQEHVVARLPALAWALGVPFDLRQALAAILGDLDAIPDWVAENGLSEAIGMGRAPGARL